MKFKIVTGIEQILFEIILGVQHQLNACKLSAERLDGFHAITALRRVGPAAPQQDGFREIAGIAPRAAVHELHQPRSVGARLGTENPIGGSALRRIHIASLGLQG